MLCNDKMKKQVKLYIPKPINQSVMIYRQNNKKYDILNLRLFRPDPRDYLKPDISYNGYIQFQNGKPNVIYIDGVTYSYLYY